MDDQSTHRKLIVGSGLRFLAMILSIVIGFLMQPFVIHTLGDDLNGVWVLATSFVGMFSLLDVGLNSAVGRHVAASLGKEDYGSLNRYLSTGYYLFTGISCIALLLSGVIAWYMIQCQPEMPHVNVVALVILIMGAQFAINLPLQAIGGLLSGALRFDISTGIGIFFKIFNTTVTFLVLYYGGQLIALAISTFILTFIERRVTRWFAFREVPQAKVAFRYADKKAVKELFSYSVFTFITTIADMLRSKIPSFIIGGYVSIGAVTHYNIPITLLAYFTMTITSILGILAPIFARQQANNDFAAIRKMLYFAVKCSTVLTVFIGFGMIAWGHPFIERWMGEEYLDSYPCLVILTVGSIVALWQSPTIGMMYGLAKHYFYSISNSIDGLLNLVLALTLVQYYGTIGVALGALIPTLFMKIVVQPWFTCRVVQERLFVYYWNVGKTFLICALALVGPFVITYYWVGPSYPRLFLVGIVSSCLYAPIVYFFAFTGAEREVVWNAIRKRK